MRSAHIITGLGTGGAERALYSLLAGGLIKRYDNHVISLIDKGTFGESISSLGVPVTALGLQRGQPLCSALKKLRRIVRGFRPDLIQGWMYHGNLAATLARFFSPGNQALVWNVRQTLYDINNEKPVTRQVIRTNRLFSSGPDALLYNSQLSRKQHEEFGFCSSSGLVIPNGIDTEKFNYSEAARNKVRSELGIPMNAFVVGHVARFHPMKNHIMYLKVASNVLSRFHEMHFLLSGNDVLLENKLLRENIPDQFLDRFHLLGERSDVSELMSAMDVYVSSSIYGEGFPNVLGEAMAIGLPCVTTDVGDSALVVGDTGKVVPPAVESALASAIEELAIMGQDKLSLLGARARQRITDNYKIGMIAEKYASLYERLILEKGTNR